jgi:predicted O-methyltransferase YrrM
VSQQENVEVDRLETRRQFVDDQLAEFLDGLYRRGREHDERQADRLQRWRNVESETAQVLAVLIRALAPRRLLELGTSNGYSTIWLADAARSVGGSLISVEIDATRVERARENLTQAGLGGVVELRVEDAAATLSASADAAWEFIFLDAERPAYPGYWPDLVRVLAPRGLLAVDNVVSHASELVEFRELVAGDERVMEALCPTGAGALLITREPTRPSAT